MRKLAICCVCALITGLVLVSCSSDSSSLLSRSTSEVTWEQAWNNNCADWNFADNSSATFMTTLGEMHSSFNFSYDISKLNIAMTEDLGEDAGLGLAAPPDLYFVYIPGGEIEPE